MRVKALYRRGAENAEDRGEKPRTLFLSFRRKPESSSVPSSWSPAFAGMTMPASTRSIQQGASAPDRHVRHLRLKASSEADVRSVVTRLEDALRCATLPDDGARLRVVRKLVLGRIASGISSQSLSLIIERRVAEIGTQWIAGGTPAAEYAICVDFASGLEARTQLALRLACGDSCTAWYWPLAVPEFRAHEGVASNLRRIACALAGLPEARVALPAWIVKLVDAGAVRQLVAAMPEAEAESLLRQAGITLLPEGLPHSSPENDNVIIGVEGREGTGTANRGIEGAISAQSPDVNDSGEAALRALPRWLRSALAASTQPRYRVLRNARALRHAVQSFPAAASAMQEEAIPAASAHHGAHSEASINDKSIKKEKPDSPQNLRSNDSGTTRPILADGVLTGSSQAGDDLPASAAFDVGKEVPIIADGVQTCSAVTHCGGLLFLLPVLARLGLVEWLALVEDSGEFAGRILLAALRRLRADADDPAWHVVTSLIGVQTASPNRAPAPASWADPLLRAPIKMNNAYCGSVVPAFSFAGTGAGIERRRAGRNLAHRRASLVAPRGRHRPGQPRDAGGTHRQHADPHRHPFPDR